MMLTEAWDVFFLDLKNSSFALHTDHEGWSSRTKVRAIGKHAKLLILACGFHSSGLLIIF
jgi:hypothetical protein